MERRNQVHVPEEIVTDIILRLPVESLLRCRTVSKLWLSIISHPQFIKSHYLIAAHKKPCILMNQTLSFTPKDFKFICLPQPFMSRYRLFIGSCNGIVCLTDNSGGDIHLWNPSTKQYKTVPEPNKYPDLYGSRCIGFGYDSTSHDYKILCLEFQGGRHDRERVQLFSTNSGCWREIVVNITLPRGRYINGPVINGILYFEFDDNYYPRLNELISFNFHNEEFYLVPLPSSACGKTSKLLDFEGSLAIITELEGSIYYEKMFKLLNNEEWENDSIDQGLDVWTLENTGQMSWIKKLSIDQLPRFNFFGCHKSLIELYLGNGEFYASRYSLSRTPEFRINYHMWYNYKTKERNYFVLQDGEKPLVLKYTESLVSLQGFQSTEPIRNRHSRNSSIMGYSQQGYQAQAPTNWAPLGQQQTTIYGYFQAGAYTGQTQQYNISQSQYPGYSPPTTSGGYATSWDQTFAKAPWTTQLCCVDYYSQQSQGYIPDAYFGHNASAPQWGYPQPQPQPGYNQQHGYRSTPGYGKTANTTPRIHPYKKTEHFRQPKIGKSIRKDTIYDENGRPKKTH